MSEQEDQVPSGRDPRLEIPEVLRTPVRQPGEIPGEVTSPKSSQLGGAGVAFAMALDFVGSIGAGVFLGWAIDRWQGWSPVGVLVGLGFGFVGAMYRIVMQSKKQERMERRNKGGK